MYALLIILNIFFTQTQVIYADRNSIISSFVFGPKFSQNQKEKAVEENWLVGFFGTEKCELS